MYYSVLFTRPKIWKQSRGPSPNVQVKKIQHMHKLELYSAVSKNEITFTRKYMELEIFSSYKINQTPFMFKNFELQK